MTNASHFDYSWWKAKNHRHCVDTHFNHAAGSVLPSLFPIKAANTFIMYSNNRTAFESPDIQDKNWLTLCWHSVDTLLTLILWMGQGACESLFCQWSQPIPHIRMTATDHHTDYPWCKTNNCWHSVDTHFAIGISTICYHLIWHSVLLLVFWQPLYHLHVLSPSSLHCSLIIHIDISCTLYIKVSANCR